MPVFLSNIITHGLFPVFITGIDNRRHACKGVAEMFQGGNGESLHLYAVTSREKCR
jgi:hypothetical protein